MTSKKDIKRLIEDARAQGWDVSMTKGNHLKWRSPCGQGILFSASTPSDHRMIGNHVSWLKRYGFQKTH